MRLFSLLLFMAFAASCYVTKPLDANKHPLNGVWIPIQQEMGGKPIPVIATASQKLTIQDTTYTLVAESTDRGTVIYSGGKMDIYGKEGPNAGKHFRAIYKLEGEQLTICYDLSGDQYPAGYETSQHPYYFLSVFKKTAK
jgi:uncharacterized protein (TIGR03067 family)